MTHFDIAPSLLELLGFEGVSEKQFGLGFSLFSKPDEKRYHELLELIKSRKRSGYFNLIFTPIIEPIIKPMPSNVKTSDQDFAPLNSFRAISGPRTFSPAAQAKMINEKPNTPITIQR